MSDVYQPPKDLSENAHCGSMAEYQRKYSESIEDPYAFWNPIVEVRCLISTADNMTLRSPVVWLLGRVLFGIIPS